MEHNNDGSFSFKVTLGEALKKAFPEAEHYPKRHTWEENGEKFSCWEISKGVFTGDRGYEEFCRMLQAELKKGLL